MAVSGVARPIFCTLSLMGGAQAVSRNRIVRMFSTDMFMLKFVSAAREKDTVSFKNMLRETAICC